MLALLSSALGADDMNTNGWVVFQEKVIWSWGYSLLSPAEEGKERRGARNEPPKFLAEAGG